MKTTTLVMCRRTALATLAGVSVLALAACEEPAPRGMPIVLPREKLLAFDTDAFLVAVAVARRVVTLPGVDPVLVAHGMDRQAVLLSPEARGLVHQALLSLEHATGRPFTGMAPEEQDETLALFRRAPDPRMRAAFVGLRDLCVTAVFAQPATWEFLRYGGQPAPSGVSSDDSTDGART